MSLPICNKFPNSQVYLRVQYHTRLQKSQYSQSRSRLLNEYSSHFVHMEHLKALSVWESISIIAFVTIETMAKNVVIEIDLAYIRKTLF